MIILEYANNSSLRQFLKTNFRKMDWNAKLNLARQVANALNYLHSDDIVHGKLVVKNFIYSFTCLFILQGIFTSEKKKKLSSFLEL